MMHPIERLRFLARSGSLPSRALVQEAAGALASFADEPQGFLTACQRVVARQPGNGPLVWLVARAITALDPYDELWAAAADMQADPTGRVLADELPDGSGRRAVVVVAGEGGGEGELHTALRRRRDVSVLVVAAGARDGGQHSQPLRAAWWEDEDVRAWRDPDRLDLGELVGGASVGPAVASSTLVLIESDAIGPEHALVPVGGVAAAGCGRALGVPVWLVGGVGRHLGPRMWAGISAPFERADPWNGALEALPLSLVDRIASPLGVVGVDAAPRLVTCPECPELFRGLVV